MEAPSAGGHESGIWTGGGDAVDVVTVDEVAPGESVTSFGSDDIANSIQSTLFKTLKSQPQLRFSLLSSRLSLTRLFFFIVTSISH